MASYWVFVKHSLLSAWRAGFLRGGWGGKILLFFSAIYFLFIAIAASFLLPYLVEEHNTDLPVVNYTARFVLYFFLADLFLRFNVQGTQKIHIHHYALLPIPFKKMVNYIIGWSFFNVFTLGHFIVLLPFAINVIAPEHGMIISMYWLLTFFAIAAGNTLLAGYLQRLFANRTIFKFLPLLLLAIFGVEVFLVDGVLSGVSQVIALPFLKTPLAFLLTVYPIAAYRINKNYLLKNRYSESWRIKADDGSLWSKLDWQGKSRVAQLMSTEWKLIIRHKRTRTAALMSVLFLFYGLFMYDDPTSSSPSNLFVAFFMISFSALNYGQYLIAWESRYFDGLLTRSLSIKDYFNAKWRLLLLLTAVPYIFSLLYGFIHPKYLIIHSVAFLYSVAVNTYVMMFFATYQRKSIDLNAGSAFNYQGASALQFLIIIPLLVAPLMVYGFVAWPFGEKAGWIAVSALSLISLACHKLWIKGTIDNFKEKKYNMADAFRSKEL